MAKKGGETFFIVDHANKRADRECANPNRKKLRSLRAWTSAPEDGADRARKAAKEQE